MAQKSLPPEIICEILLKLPVESLLRCKSVCKEWYSLISDQHFIKSHYTLSSTNINYAHHRLIYNTFEQENILISRPLHDVLFNISINNAIQLENPLQRTGYERVRIVGSCSGLLCIVKEKKDTLCIYNPTTRRSNFLSCSYNPTTILPRFQRYGLWEIYYGFGYDELSNDYKVVATREELKMPTIIYSLKTRKWKEIGHFPYHQPLADGKLLNGAILWAAGECTTSELWKIVSLDLGNETFGEVLQPEFSKGNGYLELGVSGEWLCVFYEWFESRVVDVWVMKVYGVKDSWTKLASIPSPGRLLVSSPFFILADEKLLLRFGPQLLVYDSKDGSSSEFKNKYNKACIVVESLVSPFPPLGLADINDDED